MTKNKIKKTNKPNKINLSSQENSIEIYQTKDGAIEFNADIKNQNIWASQGQIVNLFKIDQSVASRHIKNIFKDGEVDKSNMQKMHIANSDKPVAFYSLDVILAVGYRTNSKTAIEFRKWATQRLKDYLIKGFAVNEKRVKEYQENLIELRKTIKLIQDSVELKELSTLESKGFLSIITNYTQSFILLNRFDSDSLNLQKLDKNITYEIAYEEACEAITELKKQLIKKKEASELFGNQKDQSFAGILGNITQSFGGEYLYKSIEEQASHLLYFVIKNHPFSDGNKRIGAFLFIWFLEKNKHSLKKSGELKINDNGLVALALLVAQSNPKEKELMIKLIINLINEQ